MVWVGAKNRHGAVWSGCGESPPCFLLTGSFVAIQGMKFTQTSRYVFDIQGYGNVVYDNLFESSGNGADGSSSSIIWVPGDPNWHSDIMAINPPPPLVDRSARIIKNTFNTPKNVPIYQGHGSQNNIFALNIIQGPYGITAGGETMAVKVGYGAANEPVNFWIAFNSIYGWANAYPYVIGIKSARVKITNNYLEIGRICLRSADNLWVIKNMISNGDINGGNAGHIITDNTVRVINSIDGFGPMSSFIRQSTTNSYGSFDCISLPCYDVEMSNSLIARNTFLSVGDDLASYISTASFTPVWSNMPISNTIEGNILLSNPEPKYVPLAIRFRKQ